MKKIFLLLLPTIILITFKKLYSQTVAFSNSVGGQQFDQTMGVTLDVNGNIITTGYFAATADFNSSSTADSLVTSTGSNDIFVLKNDSAGNFLWAFCIGGTLDEFNYTSPITDAAGNIYLCGVYSDTVDFDPSPVSEYKLVSIGQYDGFIAKYNTSGGFVWAKSFGGLYNDDVYHLSNANNGDILFAASYNDSADLNPDTASITMYYSNGNTDIFFGRISSAGNIIWIKTMGGTDYDHPNSISENYLGEIILQGGFTTSFDADPGTATHNITGTNAPGFIAKYTQTGNYVWAHGYNSLSPFSSISDAAGNIYSCGYINDNTDLDPGPDTNKVFVIGSFDAYLAKYDINGNYIRAFGIGSTSFDIAFGINFINNNQIIVGGYFYNSVDFNPSPSITNALTSYGMGDIFIAQYDTAFNYIHAFKAGSAQFDFCRNITVSPNQNLIIVGGFSDVADFDPTATMQTLTCSGVRDGYTVKYGNVPISINNIKLPDQYLKIYPNPAHDFITITCNKNLTLQKVSIFSVDGRLVKNMQLTSLSSYQINIADLSIGFYFLKIENQININPVKFFKY